MPQHTTFEIYKASAGSGKTFSLTLHYLELALQNPTDYRRILAVTFTNKATAEMKERITEVLHGLATDNPKVEQYRSALLQRLSHFTSQDIYEKARQVYTNILHDYSRFSVTTIDSFVQRIIRSFAWELGIDGGFKLQLNTQPVKEVLADKLNLRLDDDVHLQQWVVEMARERLENGKRWEFREDMLELADELFKETFRKFEDSIGHYDETEVQERFASLNKKINAALGSIEKKWKNEGEAMISLLENFGINPEDFSRGRRGFINYFFKAAKGEPVEPGPLVFGAIDNADTMTTKTTPKAIKDKIGLVSGQLQQSLSKMVDWFTIDLHQYHTATAIKKNLSVLRLMHVFAQELGSYRKENNTLLISDTHFLLRKLTEDTSASFIYEKTGQRYQHYLIDEFQDTSAFQWANFLPLLNEALSYGHFNLVVGDVKQAIYRWRNGDWRLLLHEVEKELKGFAPRVKTLQENYRSAVQVIQFNNLLFHFAPQLLQQELNASLGNADISTQQELRDAGYNTVFNDAYADSFQSIPSKASAEGLVQIAWVPENEEATYADTVLPMLYAQVQQLLESGFVPANIAVLTRTNREAKMVVEYLVHAQQDDGNRFNVVSGDALLLAGNQAVQIIICAMRWLLNNKHTVAMAQLRQLLLLQQLQDPNRLDVFASNGDNSILPAAFIEARQQLRSLPLTELLHQLIMVFELHHLPQHNAYLLALSDKVQEWVKYGEASLHEFLQYWDDEGVSLSLPANASNNAVEVVTVHKSKGLAYDIVLMPFLNWDIVPLGGQMAPTLWADNSQTDFNDIPVLPVEYQKSLASSAFAKEYFEEFVLAAMDNLNILYVAFTRARKRLYGWAPYKEKTGKSTSFPYKHIGELMQAVAASPMPLPKNGYTDTRTTYDADKMWWQYGVTMDNQEQKDKPVTATNDSLHYTNWKERLRVRYQALANDTEDEITLPRKQGILLHDILSRLTIPAQLEEVLAQLQREGWIDNHQQGKIRHIVEDVLQLEALKPWHSSNYRRLAERSIINPEKKLRRPDLILYNSNETLVYDFKFTAGDTDRQKHEAQIREYMQMLSQMGFAAVKGNVIYGLEKKVLSIV